VIVFLKTFFGEGVCGRGGKKKGLLSLKGRPCFLKNKKGDIAVSNCQRDTVDGSRPATNLREEERSLLAGVSEKGDSLKKVQKKKTTSSFLKEIFI